MHHKMETCKCMHVCVNVWLLLFYLGTAVSNTWPAQAYTLLGEKWISEISQILNWLVCWPLEACLIDEAWLFLEQTKLAPVIKGLLNGKHMHLDLSDSGSINRM